MKSFHQFVSESQEVGVRSASTSGTIGGDSGCQARQQQGVNKFVKKGADTVFGKIKKLKKEAYDPEVAGRSQIKRSGEGGRVGADRRKSEPERRRMKAVGGGKTAPVAYKDRKDIGQQRQRSTREQQPTQERGSAASAQAAAAKEARKAAARARIAAKKAG